MFKLFNRSKGLQSPAKAHLKTINPAPSFISGGLYQSGDRFIELTKQCESQAGEIIALKAIVANLRKQKVYSGQRFYNPKDHKAAVVYLCARWNDWYMIRMQNEAMPGLMTAEQWAKDFGHYELMPKPNTNLKNLR